MQLFEAPNGGAAGGQYPIELRILSYWKEMTQFVKSIDSDLTWMMFAVTDGRFSYTINHSSGEAGPGDIVLCPPQTEFRRHVISPLSFYYIKFAVRDTESAAMQAVQELLHDSFSFKFTSGERDRLFNNFRQLIKLEQSNDPESFIWKLHFATDIWLMFYLEASHYAKRDQLARDPRMNEAKELIEKHALRNVRIQDIAARLDMNPVQLTRQFQRIFGVSPSRYLISIRMETAKKMLIGTDETIEQIAIQCGYENGFYFSRMFTKYTMMNPSNFRKIHTASSP